MRKTLIFLLLSALLAAMTTSFAVTARDVTLTGRTYYESLNLETPEDAVRTFIDAFQREDFMTVYFVLSHDAQLAFYRAVSMFAYEGLIRIGEDEDRASIFEDMPVIGTGLGREVNEHSPDNGFYIFDGLMLEAARQDRLVIDLRGDVQMTDSRSAFALDGEVPAIDVLATVEGIDGEVAFRTVISPSGRWRVLQVIVPGGDETQLPWSVPPSE